MILNSVLESRRPKYNKPLSVRGSFLLMSDIEMPFHNAKFINNVMSVSRSYKIKQAVWAGDIFHMEAFSPFQYGIGDVDEEIAEVDEYLPGMLEEFDSVTYFMGNHDQRLQRAFENKVKMENALRLMISHDTIDIFRKKVKVTEYFYCNASYNWRLTHAKNYSQIAATVAKKLSEKYHANIIHGHTHHHGMIHDVSGKYQAIESGCCLDVSRIEYPNKRDSTSAQMVNGAVLMIDTGRQYSSLLLNKWTDWEYEIWRGRKYQK